MLPSGPEGPLSDLVIRRSLGDPVGDDFLCRPVWFVDGHLVYWDDRQDPSSALVWVSETYQTLPLALVDSGSGMPKVDEVEAVLSSLCCGLDDLDILAELYDSAYPFECKLLGSRFLGGCWVSNIVDGAPGITVSYAAPQRATEVVAVASLVLVKLCYVDFREPWSNTLMRGVAQLDALGVNADVCDWSEVELGDNEQALIVDGNIAFGAHQVSRDWALWRTMAVWRRVNVDLDSEAP